MCEAIHQNLVFERIALTLPSIQDVIMPNRNRLAPQDSWWLTPSTLKNELYLLKLLPTQLIPLHVGVNLNNTPSLRPPISQYEKDIPLQSLTSLAKLNSKSACTWY